ncbi:MAG: hypothetical protein JW791_00465 [Nanoarchaeota archaeon]|nr:hypothetical protein [Nanoarchaeota archaeon]
MKKLIILILLITIIAGCTATTNQMPDIQGQNESEIHDEVMQETGSAGFQTTTPVSEFTIEDINYLKVNCSGSGQEIAECIKTWQYNNMVYAGQELGKADASDPIRWNYMLPGIFPTNEVIREHRIDNKIYGICFDYATIYCSIAEYYNLTCRVANSLSKPSDHDSSITITTGMGPEEYYRLKTKLNSNGYSYSYALMSSIAEETPEHYWAEILLEQEWVVKDASGPLGNPDYNTQLRYKDVNDWQVTDWQARDPNNKINSFSEETDDLGQTGKVFNIGDYMREVQTGSSGIAPYYESCSDVCSFFDNSIPMCELTCGFDESYFDCYESCSGKKFYKVCGFICDNEANFANCYKTCSGEEIDLSCENSC